MIKSAKRLFLLSFVVFGGVALMGDVRLPALLSDNMVLQQEREANLWGWADPGEKITISANWGVEGVAGDVSAMASIAATEADSEGKWSVGVQTPSAGGPYRLEIKGNNTLVIENVAIGEVWIGSGQSNMEMRMRGGRDQPIHGGPEDILNSANDSIRLFIVERRTSQSPVFDLETPDNEQQGGRWVVSTPETVELFSAVAYYFGREINARTGYPVGLITSSWGGTLAEAWTREAFLQTDDELKVLISNFNNQYEKWESARAEALAAGQSEPARPRNIENRHRYSALYNGMIAPLTPMTIRGVIWYQGESNAQRAYQYRKLFPTLIANWRCDFNNPQMPFYFVQLANYGGSHRPTETVEIYEGEPRENAWAELREAQFMTNRLKNTGMAVTIDIGEANCIHPGNKRDVGKRLAYWALAKDYGHDIPYSGPLFLGHFVEGDTVRLKFEHAADGLVVEGDKLTGFAIAGEDRHFVWADAAIDGSDILVSHKDVPHPVAVRYGWDIYPFCNLYNSAGLPASPFRTDDWEGITRNAQ